VYDSGGEQLDRTGLTMNRLISVAGGALLALLIAAGTAAAQQTIGADLSQAPNASFDCTVDPLLTPAPGGASCTWGTPLFSLTSTGAGGLFVPGNGTITQVNLRVGSSAGPMQVVILRSLGVPQPPPQPLEVLCCVAEAVSSPFTPVVNQVNTINVSLPVGADSNPSDDPQYLDSVGLSVLEDGVQIPAVNDASLPLEQQPGDVYIAPAMTPGQNVLASDPDGYELDMQAVFSPAAGSTAHVVGGHVPTAARGHVVTVTATREPALTTTGDTGELWVAAVARGAFARPPKW
jgi:hypothetical protein